MELLRIDDGRHSSTDGHDIWQNAHEYDSNGLEIVVKDGVAVVTYCDTKMSGHVEIPSSYQGVKVEVIGADAFAKCYQLESVHIPDGVRTIRERAFNWCIDLKSVRLPEGLIQIGKETFNWCVQLAELEIPDSVQSIGASAFNGCTDLESIHLPNNLNLIAPELFFACNSLQHVEVPANVTRVGANAFQKCFSLKSVSFPEGLKSIEDGAFSECRNLTGIQFPEGLEAIGRSAFRRSYLENVFLPASVEFIGEDAFAECNHLRTIEVDQANPTYCSDPQGALYSMEEKALQCVPNGFCGSFRVSDWVTEIGARALKGHSKVTEIFLPNNVTSIQEQAFGDCPELKVIRFEGNAPLIGENVFEGVCASALVVVSKEAQGFGTSFHGLPVLVAPRIMDIKLTSSGDFVIRLDECSEGWGVGFQSETNSELIYLQEARSVNELEWAVDSRSPQLQSKQGFFKMLFKGQNRLDDVQ